MDLFVRVKAITSVCITNPIVRAIIDHLRQSRSARSERSELNVILCLTGPTNLRQLGSAMWPLLSHTCSEIVRRNFPESVRGRGDVRYRWKRI